MTLREYLGDLTLEEGVDVTLYKEWINEDKDSPVTGGARVTDDWCDFTFGEITLHEEAKLVRFYPESDVEKLETLIESLIENRSPSDADNP